MKEEEEGSVKIGENKMEGTQGGGEGNLERPCRNIYRSQGCSPDAMQPAVCYFRAKKLLGISTEEVCHLLVWIASAAHVGLFFTLWVGLLWLGPSVTVAVTPQPPLPRSCLSIIFLG